MMCLLTTCWAMQRAMTMSYTCWIQITPTVSGGWEGHSWESGPEAQTLPSWPLPHS